MNAIATASSAYDVHVFDDVILALPTDDEDTLTIHVKDDVHSLPNLDGYDSIIWDMSNAPLSEESACERRIWNETCLV